MKICAKCKIEKSPEWFSKNPQQKDGRHVYCKDCVHIYHKKYYEEHQNKLIQVQRDRVAKNPQKYKDYYKSYRINFPDRIRNSRLVKRYGLNLIDWEKLFELQGRKCAICLTLDPGIKGWATDHSHKTGAVRGILCTSCNIGLGRFKDNLENLKRAAEYILRNQNAVLSQNPN